MNSRTQNQLNRVGAGVTVAQSQQYKPAWIGLQPLDFGAGIEEIAAAYGAVTAKAAPGGAAGEVGAENRGVTAARVVSLSAANGVFVGVMSLPRGQIVNRSTLLKEVETDMAAVLALTVGLDDQVVQFDGTEEGRRFIEAWRRARIIVDNGGGHAGGEPPTGGAAPVPPAPHA